MKYEHIIFDFNGTLVDSVEVINNILGGLITRSRFKSLTPKDFEKVGRLPFFKRLKVIIFSLKYQRKFLKLLAENVSLIKFASGVKPVLASLNQKNIPFSILSANDKDMIIEFFGLHRISIDSVYRSQRLLGKKNAIKKFIKQRRCAPNGVLYISDEVRDAAACARCGVDMIFVKWGIDANEDISGLNIKAAVGNPEELFALLTA